MKRLTIGIIGAILTLITITSVYAAFVTGVGTIEVPQGKTAIYYIMNNADAAELRDALCHNHNYQELVLNEANDVTLEYIENPESCTDFADRMLKQHGIDQIMTYRAANAAPVDLGTEPVLTN